MDFLVVLNENALGNCNKNFLYRSITTKVNGSFQITNWASFPYKSILVPVRTSDGFFRFV